MHSSGGGRVGGWFHECELPPHSPSTSPFANIWRLRTRGVCPLTRPLNRQPPPPSLSHSSLCSLGPLQSENLVRHRASPVLLLFLSVRTLSLSRFPGSLTRRNAVLLRPPGFVIAISLESNKMGRREGGRKGLRKAKRGTTISPLIFLVFFLLPLCLRLRFHPTFESPLSFVHPPRSPRFVPFSREWAKLLACSCSCVRPTHP